MLIEANAIRTDGLITVIVLGQLPTPCDEVEEVGHYPGNGMSSARVFVSVKRKPGLENINCIMGPGNIWSINRVIRDQYSQTVEIFINDCFVSKIRVKELTIKGIYNIH